MSDVETNTVTKTCTSCKEEKFVTEFHADRKRKDGHQTYCKKCASDKNRAYHEANKEVISARQRIWREVNKEKHTALCKNWYEANKERKAITMKAWRDENKEHCINYSKSYYSVQENKERHAVARNAWSKSHPEIRSAYERNRNARKRESSGTHTTADINNLLVLQRNKCAACNKSISKGYHVDHIIALSNGGSNDKYNLQLLCAHCNCSKHAKDPIDFMQSRGMLL